jgi:hypothetical protein
MRQFIRHPVDVPVEIGIAACPASAVRPRASPRSGPTNVLLDAPKK